MCRLAKLKLWWISCWYDFPNFHQFNFLHSDNAITDSIGSHLFLNENYLVIICHAHSQISQYEHVFYMTSCVFQVLYQCCSFFFLICLFLLFSKGSVAMWPNYARGGSKRAFLVRPTFFICCAQIIPSLYPDPLLIGFSWHNTFKARFNKLAKMRGVHFFKNTRWENKYEHSTTSKMDIV